MSRGDFYFIIGLSGVPLVVVTSVGAQSHRIAQAYRSWAGDLYPRGDIDGDLVRNNVGTVIYIGDGDGIISSSGRVNRGGGVCSAGAPLKTSGGLVNDQVCCASLANLGYPGNLGDRKRGNGF
ncbi:MAG: hypothetical protein KIPDCIKN_03904 [Haliscomenobacter sp.]|nr:hypothetical protein [Haliscomenobacter sp.]